MQSPSTMLGRSALSCSEENIPRVTECPFLSNARRSSAGTLKSAASRNLKSFFQQQDTNSDENSSVVSTPTVSERRVLSVQIYLEVHCFHEANRHVQDEKTPTHRGETKRVAHTTRHAAAPKRGRIILTLQSVVTQEREALGNREDKKVTAPSPKPFILSLPILLYLLVRCITRCRRSRNPIGLPNTLVVPLTSSSASTL